jgi:hypothetical protein
MVAYKVGAEGGDDHSQHQVGAMYYQGLGVDVDYAQALAWTKKAAAQDDPYAVNALGVMYFKGQGVTPSFRRAREYYERAIELDDSEALENMQTLTTSIQAVTSRRSIYSAPSSLVRDLTLPYTHTPPSLRLHAQVAPLMDKRVEIHGTTREDMNGKRGVATDFHPMGGPDGDRTTWRYTVKLDGGEAFKLKPANLRAEGTGGGDGGGGGSGGGGKAKGKKGGKKGRAGRK